MTRPHSASGHMLERGEKRKESGSKRRGDRENGRCGGRGRVGGNMERGGRKDDRHRLLFASLTIYTLTQTESISQSPDILPTPLCEGTSPWQSLVGVGDGTHTRGAGLTAA